MGYKEQNDTTFTLVMIGGGHSDHTQSKNYQRNRAHEKHLTWTRTRYLSVTSLDLRQLYLFANMSDWAESIALRLLVNKPALLLLKRIKQYKCIIKALS